MCHSESYEIKRQVEKLIHNGESLFIQGDMERALNIFNKILKIDPNNSIVHNNIGVLYYQAGKTADACNSFATALKKDPENYSALVNGRLAFEALDVHISSSHDNRIFSNIDILLFSYLNNNWLTVGDGYGRDAHYIGLNGSKATATDINDVELLPAKKVGYISEYKQENAESLTFKNGKFDFVLCKEALHHFSRPAIAIYEMIRVASKAVILIEPNDVNGALCREFEPNGDFVFTMSERELAKLCVGLKLGIIAFKPFNLCYQLPMENYDVNPEIKAEFLRKWNETIAHTDLLSKTGKRPYDSLVSIIFKKPRLSIPLRQKLLENNYRLEELPISITCQSCNKSNVIKYAGKWKCRCGFFLSDDKQYEILEM